ncbi:p21-C-terminal region-binding domain containing protein [Amanita muscaria]
MDSDPYALLTMINMHTNHVRMLLQAFSAKLLVTMTSQERPAIKSLAAYLLSKAAQIQPKLHSTLQTLFSQPETHVGLVICERLVNMPVQIIPPMYRMLLEELRNALSAGKPYKFSHLIFLSRTYHLSNDEESELAAHRSQNSPTAKSKKSKKAKTGAAQPQVGEEYDLMKKRPEDGIYPFHPEDLLIMQLAEYSMDYKFDKAPEGPREKESFGLDTRGRVMLLRAEKFEELVKKMTQVYNGLS